MLSRWDTAVGGRVSERSTTLSTTCTNMVIDGCSPKGVCCIHILLAMETLYTLVWFSVWYTYQVMNVLKLCLGHLM